MQLLGVISQIMRYVIRYNFFSWTFIRMSNLKEIREIERLEKLELEELERERIARK